MTRTPFNLTQVIATIGPASDSPAVLRQMIGAGMDMARINGAHGGELEIRHRVQAIRHAGAGHARPLPILLDLPGPKLRLGVLPGGSVTLRRDQRIDLSSRASAASLPVADPSILPDLKRGEPVFLADGSVELRVQAPGSSRVRCRVETGGTVRTRSGMNLPETRLSLRIPTIQDRALVRLACELNVEWLGLSYVRTAEDVRHIRTLLKGGARAPRVIAKIENRSALNHLHELIGQADGVMVARGDLGVETPLAEVPLTQKRILQSALRAGKPSIVATQMLESMVDNPFPTRAEVTDVANALLDGADAVMLSAETAIGAHPVAAVRMLERILTVTEKALPYKERKKRVLSIRWDPPRKG